jgi:hypothetical protein
VCETTLAPPHFRTLTTEWTVDDRPEPEIRIEREADQRGGEAPATMNVRDEDLEPHAGLRYVARLFKVLSLLLLLLLIAEIVLGLVTQGQDAIPTLLVEATRLIVFAGLLWGAADMALMLIESNHDLRATRILVGRLNGKVQRLEDARWGASAPDVSSAGPAERERRPRAP